MKKGSKWKRVFVHHDGKIFDSFCSILAAAKIEHSTRATPTSRRSASPLEHAAFVQLKDLATAIPIVTQFNTL